MFVVRVCFETIVHVKWHTISKDKKKLIKGYGQVFLNYQLYACLTVNLDIFYRSPKLKD